MSVVHSGSLSADAVARERRPAHHRKLRPVCCPIRQSDAPPDSRGSWRGGISCRIGSRIGSVINLKAIRRGAASYASDSIAGAKQQRQTTKLIGILTNF
jgi:hypothetical protein